MINEELTSAAMDMAKIANYRLHAKQLDVPLVDGFSAMDVDNPQIVLFASCNGITEQLTSDGYVEDGDFDNRVELVIANTKLFMTENKFEDVDKSFIYYKDYTNGVFNYKLYIQDMIIPDNGERNVIRSLIAYFVEPKMHDFYQMTLSIGPFVMPTEELKVGVIDLENDQVTMALDGLMMNILNNLKYKKEN